MVGRLVSSRPRLWALSLATVLIGAPLVLGLATAQASAGFTSDEVTFSAVDTDGDQIYEGIDVAVMIASSDTVSLRLEANVSTGDHANPASAIVERTVDVAAGRPQEFHLVIPAQVFLQLEHNGTFRVILSLQDDSNQLDTLRSTTPAYFYTQFQSGSPTPSISMGTVTDHAILDDEGAIVSVRITITIEAEAPTTVEVLVWIGTERLATPLSLANGSAGVASGTGHVEVLGQTFVTLAHDGPYEVPLEVLHDGVVLAESTHTTAAYALSRFAAALPPAAFEEPSTVRLLPDEQMRPSTGLAFDVHLRVRRVGAWALEASPRPCDPATPTPDLPSLVQTFGSHQGLQQVTLELAGAALFDSGIDGSLCMFLSIGVAGTVGSGSIAAPFDSEVVTTGVLDAAWFTPAIPLLHIGAITDHLLVSGSDDLATALEVTIQVRAEVQGEVTIQGLLGTGPQDWLAATKIGFLASTDQVTRALRFDSADIVGGGHDGPFLVRLILDQPKTNGSSPLLVEHLTSAYRLEQLAPRAPPAELLDPPLAPADVPAGHTQLDAQWVITRGPMAEFRTAQEQPLVMFSYNPATSQYYPFRLVFSQLVLGTDRDQDKNLSATEVRYGADLATLDWKLSPLAWDENGTLHYELRAPVSLVDSRPDRVGRTSGAPDQRVVVRQWGVLSLRFSWSEDDRILGGPGAPMTISGEDQLEIEVVIEVLRPLQADLLVLREFLIDESRTHTLRSHEQDGPHDLTESTLPSPRRFSSRQDTRMQQVSFVSSPGGERHGYFAWSDQVASTSDRGSVMDLVVGAQIALVEGNLLLSLSYPLSATTRKLVHDPSVGVDPTHQAPRHWTVQTLPTFSPSAYVIAAVGGVTALAAAGFAGRSRRAELDFGSTEHEQPRPPQRRKGA